MPRSPSHPSPRRAAASRQWALALACVLVLPAAASDDPDARVLVDPAHGLAVTLPADWHGVAPAPGLDQAVLVLHRRPSDRGGLQEGHFHDDALKIELTTGDFAARGGAPFAVGPLTGHAVLRPGSTSTDGPPSPPALVLRFALHDPTTLTDLPITARLVPADSLVLDAALPILASLRPIGADGEPVVAGRSADGASDGLSRLRRSLARPTKTAAVDLASFQAEQALAVSRPITGSTVIRTKTYRVQWSGSGTRSAAVELLQGGAPIRCLHPREGSCEPAPLNGEFLDWRVDSDLEGAYQVRVRDSAGAVGTSGTFSIDNACGPHVAGSEALPSPIELHLPFAPGTRWTVGGGGSFYGGGFHCNGYNDYYATDWNQAGVDDETGARVLAIAYGEVIEVVAPDADGECAGALGCKVSIEHRPSADADRQEVFQTTYAHLESVAVTLGAKVRRGQDIGTVGSTGSSSAAHLHLQFRAAWGNGWASRCNAAEEDGLCANGEMPAGPQGYRPSPMTTVEGDVELVDAKTYTSDNGIAVTAPIGDDIVWQIGETETVRWLTYLPHWVRVDLCHEDHGCRFLGTRPTSWFDRLSWTVSDSVIRDDGYFVRVADADQPAVQHVSPPITIVASDCSNISLLPSSLPDGTVGETYQAVVSASGGMSPYAYAVSAGALPPGTSLSTGGTLSGEPTEAGVSSFTVRAEDAEGCNGQRSYQVEIVEPAPTPCGIGEVCVQLPGQGLAWTYDLGQCDGNANDGGDTDPTGYGVYGPFPSYCDYPSENDFRIHAHWCDAGTQYCLSDFSDPNWNDEGIEYDWSSTAPNLLEFTPANFEPCGPCTP